MSAKTRVSACVSCVCLKGLIKELSLGGNMNKLICNGVEKNKTNPVKVCRIHYQQDHRRDLGVHNEKRNTFFFKHTRYALLS